MNFIKRNVLNIDLIEANDQWQQKWPCLIGFAGIYRCLKFEGHVSYTQSETELTTTATRKLDNTQ